MPGLARQLAQTLTLNSSGHFVNFPDHYCQRDRPIDYLLIWVLAGRGFARTEGARHAARSGHLLTFAPRHPHAYGADPAQPWEILWVHFSGRLARSLLRRLRELGGGACADLGLDGELRDRWTDLVLAHAPRSPRFEVRVNAALYGLLGLVVNRLELRGSGPPAPEPAFDWPALQRYIQARMDRPITLAELADHAGLSVSHFSRVFRRLVGVSPMHHVLQSKVALAGTLLAQTAQPIKQVSRAVGVEDPYYFSRLFTRFTGVSPSAYRAGRRGQREA